MRNIASRSKAKIIDSLRLLLKPSRERGRDLAVELDDGDIDLIKYVLDNNYTMTSIPRLISTVKACRYIVENKIPGDFVECGVWRGGNGILAQRLFEQLDSDRCVWMFDTFEGMTAPTEFDVASNTKVHAGKKFAASQQDSHNDWCYASLEDVKRNCEKSNLSLEKFRFVRGDVSKTLKDKANLPTEIAILRLDTDWYESTKVELEILYPNLCRGGVLIIDDYGHWEGARKAVDEYFSGCDFKPLLNVVDYTCRIAVKM